jgi:hypothetical protein
MDHIDKVLTSASDSPYKFSVAIRAALVIGKNAMNRYYNKTDQSEVYRIAMGKCSTFIHLRQSVIINLLLVLHPRHKLEYFKAQKWENEWIQAARNIVREEFDRSYKESGFEDAMQLDSTVSIFKPILSTFAYLFPHRRLRHRQRTYSTISLIWLPRLLTTMTNSNATWQPTLRM